MDYKGSINEIIKKHNTDPKRGLSSSEAANRLEKYGANIIESSNKKSLLKKIIEQIADPMVILLILASIVSAFTGDVIECIIIIAIVVINAIMSIIQEGKAEDSVAALQKMSSPEATVIRDGKRGHVKAEDLVPGDIVVLETGDIIPADMRLIEASNLKIDESSLTGESVAVEKNADFLTNEDVGIGDRENYVHSSSIVTYGHGIGLVTETASNTEIGKIATSLEAVEDKDTPLQRQLKKLSKLLAILVIVVCIAVFAVGYFRGGTDLLENFMVAVSLAVAAIPEGLTAVVTIVLSIGMNRMAERKAIVKNLLSVETLGSTTVICSDKTGTLTQNEMTITKIYTNNEEYEIEGSGYKPEGNIRDAKKETVEDNDQIKLLMTIASLCNDANLIRDGEEYKITGDPTEGAMLTFSEKWNINQEDLNKKHPRLNEIPFDSTRKMMTTFHQLDGKYFAMTKGAPDVIMKNSSHILIDGQMQEFTDELKDKMADENNSLASQALRVMAYAFRPLETLELELTSENIERKMIFVGLTGMIDPPRPEAKAAVAECHASGIDVIMITGDYFETALAIAKELGIATSRDQAMQGSDLNDKSEEEIREIVKTKRIFARVSPENKVQLVKALEANDNVVAMTGDGVNDAPAIKNADIGVSMGITGTDVAKDASDMILVDDNFATIVNAVEEGRVIFSNIKKFVSFLLSCNIAEVLIVFISILLGLPSPLTPIQLLWLNLVTDAFPALALGVEPAEPGLMEEPPRDPRKSIISGDTSTNLALQSIYITVTVLLAYIVGLKFIYPDSIEGAHTMVFATLITSELLRAFSVRSNKYTLKELGFTSNPQLIKAVLLSFALMLIVMYIPLLNNLFEIVVFTWQWIPVIILALIPLVLGELGKVLKKNK